MITDAILQKFKRALACAGVLFCNQIESAVRVLFYNQCVAVFCCVDMWLRLLDKRILI